MTKLADITLFESIGSCSGARSVCNAGLNPQMIPTRPDVEFGWKYRWVTDDKGKLGIYHKEDTMSLGTFVRRNMAPVFTNLKNAILNYNKVANDFSRNMKAAMPRLTVPDQRKVANVVSQLRGFQTAGNAMLKQFNINMPVAG